ncbi:MAG: ferredoxin [Oscillibacter sp.]|nr:ferredoxin [Oscillibacter sp.]
MTVTVDAGKCIGCGMCAYVAPEVFRIAGAVSTVHSQPDKRTRYRVRDARNGCPVNAIAVRDGEKA